MFHMPQKHITCPKSEIDQFEIEQVKDFNFIGELLNWKSHVEYISGKLIRRTGALNIL